MDAILLLVSEFTEELIWAQVCLITFWSALYLYHYVVKRRETVSPELVPSAVVKDYLNRVRDGEQQIRFQLFGEVAQGGSAPVIMSGGTDPNMIRELEMLRGRVGESDQKIQDRDRTIAELKARPMGGNPAELDAAKAAWANEKADLEKKLAAALAAGSSTGGGIPPEVTKQLEEMKARLQEYEVIEDDLANLKKYQLENKQLIEQMMAAGMTPNATVSKGSAPAAAAPAPAPAAPAAPAPEATVAAAPTPAAPAAPAAAPAASAATDSNVVAINPTAPPTPVAGTPSPEKKEEDLLSEFEKMLAS